jgi:5'(3')-deoxyribonucleotidase
MTIILDLDDVLANLRESLYRTLHRTTGIDHHWSRWNHYDLTQHYGMEKDALHDILKLERALESCLPEPNAAETTRQLAELGFEIAIVTARGWHAGAAELTRLWLQEHRIHHDHLAVVALGGNKLEVLTPFREIAFAVDDHPNNIRRYDSVGIASLMVDMPWNAHYDGNRIYSLDAVLEYARELTGNR